MAWVVPGSGLHLFEIPQLVARAETARRATLPSFLYLADQSEQGSGLLALPWAEAPQWVAGVFARDEGALTPARQASSAKSWLSNAHVDRTAPLLPWGSEAVARISPVEASARLLGHLRDAWNHERAERFESLPIVLTVPASFDDEARELTVQAARDAGLADVTLLEEPLAAVYAWISTHRHLMAAHFRERPLLLVCDAGGGTTDFTLVRAETSASGEIDFERVAIGEHLLLGGDNVDLALAVGLEQKFPEAGRLTVTQKQSLRRKCSAAKEALLGDAAPDHVPVTLLGAGRGVVSGGMTASLSRDEVLQALLDGFLPLVAPDDLPARDRRVGLRELGLPYEPEAAVTRHLAAFLTRAAAPGERMARPDTVLFNGGFFTPPIARERIMQVLERWFGRRPAVLENPRPEAAVALGAAFYGLLRRSAADGLRSLLIRAGSARTYYIGLAGEGNGAVCVMPRGTQEGTTLPIDQELSVLPNQPAAFTLYSSTSRSDTAGAAVRFSAEDEFTRHTPLVTALRFGKRSRRVPLPVRLSARFTETGTLELWLESPATGHRWRLAYNLRASEADPLASVAGGAEEAEAAVVIAEAGVARSEALVRAVFEAGDGDPATLSGDLETALGHARAAWPLPTIRQLADVLLSVEHARQRSPAHEARWLNLAGFCVRPGFGTASDEWRISELRKVYAAGLRFPKETQNQVEWIVLWQRAGAGFRTGQQRELALKMTGLLAIGARKPPRLNAQLEREAWRLLASLERLDPAQKAKLGDVLLERVRREPRNPAWSWSLGRLGARVPVYGPLNTVVAPEIAGRWLSRLLELRDVTPDIAAAITEIGARTGDPARDVAIELSDAAAGQLERAGMMEAATALRHAIPRSASQTIRAFGEPLPEGLQLG